MPSLFIVLQEGFAEHNQHISVQLMAVHKQYYQHAPTSSCGFVLLLLDFRYCYCVLVRYSSMLFASAACLRTAPAPPPALSPLPEASGDEFATTQRRALRS